MARTTRARQQQCNEEILVSAFRNIQLHFPGDVYCLAVLIAMSDRAHSTPTCQRHTTLHGLASKCVSLYLRDYSGLSSIDGVMAVFHRHGITGNPVLRLDSEGVLPRMPLIDQFDSNLSISPLCLPGISEPKMAKAATSEKMAVKARVARREPPPAPPARKSSSKRRG